MMGDRMDARVEYVEVDDDILGPTTESQIWIDGQKVSHEDLLGMRPSGNHWVTQKKAVDSFGKSKRTIQSWVQRYGVRRRVNLEGYVEYNLDDLDEADWRSRHRGGHPDSGTHH